MTFVCFSSNESRLKIEPLVARERKPTKVTDGFDEVDNGLSATESRCEGGCSLITSCEAGACRSVLEAPSL